MSALTVSATVRDALGLTATAVASCTIGGDVPADPAEWATWGRTTSVRTTNATYSTPGQVVNGVHFDGARVSATAGVVLNDCRLTGDSSTAALLTLTNDTARDPVILNRCVLSPKFAQSATNGINGHDVILNDCLIEKVTDGMQIQNTTRFNAHGPGWSTGVELHRTVIRRLARWTAPAGGIVHPTDSINHGDGVQQFGGVGTVLDRVLIDCRTPALQYGHLYLMSPSGHVYTEAEAYALPDDAPLISVPMGSLANGGPYAFAGDSTHPPRPLPWESNGTGLISRGELASPDLACMMINSTQGPSSLFDIRDCVFRGGEFSINGGGNPYPAGSGLNWGQMLRSRFDHSQGDQGGGGDTTNTVTFWGNWAGHATIPTTGPDANLYDTGAPIKVRL